MPVIEGALFYQNAGAAREITCTVAVQALTAGCLTGWLYYVVSQASA